VDLSGGVGCIGMCWAARRGLKGTCRRGGVSDVEHRGQEGIGGQDVSEPHCEVVD
jgi:hypothetical protein